jgi:hypothetical protein
MDQLREPVQQQLMHTGRVIHVGTMHIDRVDEQLRSRSHRALGSFGKLEIKTIEEYQL